MGCQVLTQFYQPRAAHPLMGFPEDECSDKKCQGRIATCTQNHSFIGAVRRLPPQTPTPHPHPHA